MAVNPLVASSLIQAGGSLLGGLFGGDKGPGAREQINNQKQAIKTLVPAQIAWSTKAIMDAAKTHGIHPSVLLGSGAGGYSPSFAFNSGGGSGSDFSEIGQNVGRAAYAFLTRKERAVKDTHDMLQLENMGLQNDLLRSQITSVNRSSGVVPARDDLSIYEGGVSPHKAGDPSRADLKPMTSWRTLTTPDGREVVVPSPEAGVWMEQDLLGTPRWYADLIYGAVANSGKATGRWLRKKYDQFRGR